ncbi:transmembrane protein, putative [Rhizoctonia solani AG-3 Rhs1AP]|uniref:Transmembrane protein, putative n=1 Tax=Rhizoctonia solani AG-3 Rhs1AP TaxID=1086054 RepID=X8J192_9AGAM|nr:transmembrane protein, putative [Rhizoctonia solani AG-3 Rhs1AP]
MQSNQHKRLAKRILRRFEPTWTGQAVDMTSALAITAIATEAQPTTTSIPQLPTTSLVLNLSTSTPVVPTTQAQLTTSTPTPVLTLVLTPSSTTETSTSSIAVATSQSTSATVLSTLSTGSTTSTSASLLTTSDTPTLISSTPAQTTAAPPPTTTKAAAPAVTTPTSRSSTLIRTTSSYTDSDGLVINTIVVIQAPAPTATESATPKSTGNAGTIVGAVAGGFVAIICLIAFVSWIIRQHNRRKGGNHDDFDKQSYLRNSMMIPDEPDHPVRGTQAALALARSNTHVGPRPPTMIERKNTYYTHGQPSPTFAPGQVISFEPGQIVSAPPTAGEPAYPSPVAFAAYTPPDQHHQSELARRPSGAQLLNRAPTNGGMYDHSYAPSAVSYGPDSYRMQSPDSYAHDAYTYPMHPGAVDHRGMVQSVTPYQAQQYAEITRQLENAVYEHDSFHAISPGPGPASPSGPAVSRAEVDSPTKGSPIDEHLLPNPFDEKRIDSMPPALPVIESLSRTGTPIDPNPQYAHWSYDSKAQNGGNRLSVAGMQTPEPTTPPPMAVIHEGHPTRAPANVAQPAKRPDTMFDVDDAYGGI